MGAAGLDFYLVLFGSVSALELGSVQTIFMARLLGEAIPLVRWIWIAISFALVAGINVLTVFCPMGLGIQRLSRLEE